MGTLSDTGWWVLYALMQVYIVLGIVFSLYNLKAYWALRKERVVRIRAPQLVAVNHFIGLFYMLGLRVAASTFSVIQSPIPLIIDYLTSAAGFMLFGIFVVMRAWYLNWAYAYATNQLKMQWRSQLDFTDSYVSSRSWAIRFAWIFRDYRILGFFGVCAVFVVVSIASLVSFVLVPGIGFTSKMAIFYTCFLIPISALMYIALHSTKSSRDIYHLRREMQLIIAEWCVVACVFGLNAALFGSRVNSRGLCFSMTLDATTGFFIHFFLSTRWVLWQNHQFFVDEAKSARRLSLVVVRSLSSSPKSDETGDLFKRLLANSVGFEMFAEHCVREMSSENVLFVVAYMRFKQYLFLFVHYLVDSGVLTVEADTSQELSGGGLLQRMPSSTSILGSESQYVDVLHVSKTFARPKSVEVTESDGRFLFSSVEASETFSLAARGLSLSTFGTLVVLPRELLAFRGDHSAAGNPSLDACVHKLLDIYDLFLRSDAGNALNISGRIRQTALDKLRTFVVDDDYQYGGNSDGIQMSQRIRAQSIQTELQQRKEAREIDEENRTLQNVFEAIRALDSILKQAVSVLRHDSFPRFLETPEFERWAEENEK